jgi:hypothetical protein
VTAPPAFASAAAAASDELTERLGVPPAGISVESGERVDWPNSALGCEEPGLLYLQVIIPGWLLSLLHGGLRYEYHTDLDGKRVVTCDPKLAGG